MANPGCQSMVSEILMVHGSEDALDAASLNRGYGNGERYLSNIRSASDRWGIHWLQGHWRSEGHIFFALGGFVASSHVWDTIDSVCLCNSLFVSVLIQ